MIELYNLGLNDNNIKDIVEMFPEIKNLSNDDIANNIKVLRDIDCNNRHIKNILICNPFYLYRSIDDILNLIKKILEIGMTNINLLFDSNPFLLNKDDYEIDDYINKQMSIGKSIEDIVDEIDSNPYIIDEIE